MFEVFLATVLYDISTGKQLSIFEPYLQGERLCARTVFNYNFGLCIVQHLQGLNEIYLQKMADIEKVQQLLGELYVFYDEGTPEPLEEFEPGTLCAAKSSDGNWYRAIIIIGINRDADVTVQFPDYGNKETVPKDKVKKLDPSFFEPCARALVAKLGLVPLRHDAVTELSKWTLDKEVQVTLVYEDGRLATLHLDGADSSMKLVNEKPATPEVSSEPVPLLSNAVLQMPDKVGKIEQIRAELAAAADTYKDLQTLESGTPCVAEHFADGLRYRARVLYPDNKNTAVRFIDYGNLVVFHKRRGLIKKMPESMYVHPLAARCYVDVAPTGQWFEALVGDTRVDLLVAVPRAQPHRPARGAGLRA
ncbi:tudor domain-containing protein 1-like [Cydia strobilella]|uniref:tudor domain-containing protein 1-like n=1 Tax=Cydia strobilella TaxID=1100964 RepID=UPI0030044847